jgi:RNA polymerase sigma-70 factor (ECF subfamily)
VSEEVQALRQALWALPAEYREPLLLQTLGGLCCEEIAAELALPVGRVMTRYFRARRRLRTVLAADHARRGPRHR